MSAFLTYFAALPIDKMEAHLRKQEAMRFDKTGRYMPVEHMAMVQIYKRKLEGSHDTP